MKPSSAGVFAAGLAAAWLAAAPLNAATTAPSAAAPDLYTSEDDPSHAGVSALSLHKLNYAVMGRDGLKLQYSFKLRVVDGVPFFFSFTNTILWQAFEDSIPAKDSVFNPECFYRLKEEKDWFVTLDAGYIHHSNGRAGLDSRSIDRLAVRVHKAGMWGRRPWVVTTQIFPAVLSLGEYNRDYDDYVGWWDLEIWLRNVLGQSRRGMDLQLARTSGRGGHPWQRGSNIVGLQYRMEAWPRVNPILYVQWFSGHGEMMIDYPRYTNEVRGGISWFY